MSRIVVFMAMLLAMLGCKAVPDEDTLGEHAGYRTEDIHVGLEVSTLILRTGFGDSASVGVAGVGSWR